MSPVSGIGGLNEVKAMLGTGSVDSRSIHFGANESKEDRMRRIEEITKGNPNVKLSPEAFQKLMQGGDVDVTLNLDAPDRRNLFIGAFATLAQIGGSAGGAAYNKDLGEAVAGRVSGDAQFVAKHGNNYKMNLFGGAEAQTGRIEVGDPVFDPTLSNDDITTDQIKKNLAVQASQPIINKPQRGILNTDVHETAQVYEGELGVKGHDKNAPKVGIKNVRNLDVENISGEIARGLGISQADLKRFGLGKMNVGELVAGFGNDKKGTVQGINITKASELDNSGVSVNLNAVLFLMAKQNGRALSKDERKQITDQFNASGVDGVKLNGKGIDRNELVDFKSKLAEVKRESARDFTKMIFASLSPSEKLAFMEKAGVENEQALADKLKTSKPEELFKIYKLAEQTNLDKTGLKKDGYTGRQHVMDAQKSLSDRIQNLQGGAANLAILAGNSSKNADGSISITGNDGKKGNLSDLSHFYNGSFVTDPAKMAEVVVDYQNKNGALPNGIQLSDEEIKIIKESIKNNKANNKALDPELARKVDSAFQGIAKKQQDETAKVYNEANGTNLSFQDIAKKAAGGEINSEVANAIEVASKEQEKIASVLSGNGGGLALSSAGANIYARNNNVLQENLGNITAFTAHNLTNAEAIRNRNSEQVGGAVNNEVTLTIGNEKTTEPVAIQAAKLTKAIENGSIAAMSPTDKKALITVLENAQAAVTTPSTSSESKAEVGKQDPIVAQAIEKLKNLASPTDIATQNQATITKNIGNVNTFLDGNGNQTESQLQKAKEAIKKIKEDIGSATPENQELFKKLETRLGAIVAQTNAGAVGAAKTTQAPPSDPLLAQFSNIGKSLPPAEKPKDDSSLKKVLEELAKAGNEIASILFGVADQILDRLNKEAAGSFDYGFGHQNGGRITKKIGGAEDQDKDSNGNSNVSSQAFQDGFKTGERTKAAFDVLAQYKANREAEARDGSVSIREGVRRYNDNISKYIAGSTPTDQAETIKKHAINYSMTSDTKIEPTKHGQRDDLAVPTVSPVKPATNNDPVEALAKTRETTGS